MLAIHRSNQFSHIPFQPGTMTPYEQLAALHITVATVHTKSCCTYVSLLCLRTGSFLLLAVQSYPSPCPMHSLWIPHENRLSLVANTNTLDLKAEFFLFLFYLLLGIPKIQYKPDAKANDVMCFKYYNCDEVRVKIINNIYLELFEQQHPWRYMRAGLSNKM